jgi:hypothetical protein
MAGDSEFSSAYVSFPIKRETEEALEILTRSQEACTLQGFPVIAQTEQRKSKHFALVEFEVHVSPLSMEHAELQEKNPRVV